MSWLTRIGSILKSLLRRARMENEMDAEMRLHIESCVEDRLRSGMSRDEAERSARLDFGSIESAKEECREARGLRLFDELSQDLRLSARNLKRSPLFTITASVTLALGIGGTTSIFSIVNAVLIRSLPYADSGSLVMLWGDDRARGAHEVTLSYPDLELFRERGRTLQDLAFFTRTSSTLTDTQERRAIDRAIVSPNLFGVMGMKPRIGRTFSWEEAQDRRLVAVISYGFWQSRFGSMPDAIGRFIEIDGQRWQVIGAMPSEFVFPVKDVAVWTPHGSEPWWPIFQFSRKGRWQAIGRLRPHVAIERAQREFDAMAADQLASYKSQTGYSQLRLVPLRTQVVGRVRTPLLILMGAVALVLLIACANVAGLQLARGSARGREIAVRVAMGAGRGRLIRYLLTESVLLGLAAGVIGLQWARWGVSALVALGPRNIPRLEEARVDAPVLAFAVLVSLFAALLSGAWPAWKVSRRDPIHAIKGSPSNAGMAHASWRARGLLVSAEFALAIVLLTGAGLLIRSFVRVSAVDLGFDPQHVLVATAYLPEFRSSRQASAFCQQMVEGVERLPGVRSAGAINYFFSGEGFSRSVTIEGETRPRTDVAFDEVRVDGNLFLAAGVPLLRGRFLLPRDAIDSPPAAVISESAAKAFWPGQDPLGKRFRTRSQWTTVVGVVGNLRRHGIESVPVPQIFIPGNQKRIDLLVRTVSEPEKIGPEVRQFLLSLDAKMKVTDVSTLAEQMDAMASQRRFQTVLLGLFSAVSLLLAAVGIYGLMRYSVMQRTHEIGVRMALGASPSAVAALVLRQGLLWAIAGVVIGSLSAMFLTRALKGFLFGIGALDPLTFAGVAGVLVAAGAMACYFPARRAATIDPLAALRYE